MKTQISNELLSVVIGTLVTKIRYDIIVYEDRLYYDTDNEGVKRKFSPSIPYISIYELTFKLKEYLYNNGYESFSGPAMNDVGKKFYSCDLYRAFGTSETYVIKDKFEAETELEAVIKACEWIKSDEDN